MTNLIVSYTESTYLLNEQPALTLPKLQITYSPSSFIPISTPSQSSQSPLNDDSPTPEEGFKVTDGISLTISTMEEAFDQLFEYAESKGNAVPGFFRGLTKVKFAGIGSFLDFQFELREQRRQGETEYNARVIAGTKVLAETAATTVATALTTALVNALSGVVISNPISLLAIGIGATIGVTYAASDPDLDWTKKTMGSFLAGVNKKIGNLINNPQPAQPPQPVTVALVERNPNGSVKAAETYLASPLPTVSDAPDAPLPPIKNLTKLTDGTDRTSIAPTKEDYSSQDLQTAADQALADSIPFPDAAEIIAQAQQDALENPYLPEPIPEEIPSLTLDENSLALYQTVTDLGEIGSILASKIAALNLSEDTATQLIGVAAAKTLGGYLGDALQFGREGVTIPAIALRNRLLKDFASNAVGTAISGISEAIIDAIDLEDPLAQLGVDAVISSVANHYFSKYAVGNFGPEFAVKVLGVSPDILETLDADFSSIKNSALGSITGALESFITSKLFDKLTGEWGLLDEELRNEWANYGGLLGGLLFGSIGSLVGQAVGGLLGKVFGDEDYARAAYQVGFDPELGRFVTQPLGSTGLSYVLDEGDQQVGTEMAQMAENSLNLIIAMIGGQPLSTTNFFYGHYKDKLIYQPQQAGVAPGDINALRFDRPTAESAVQSGVIEQLKTTQFEDGDPYLLTLINTLPTDNSAITFESLFADLGIAKEYSIHKADPLLYGQMIANLPDQNIRSQLLDNWRTILQRVEELGLRNLTGDTGEFLAGTVDDDVIVGGTGDDFIYAREGNDRLEGREGNDYLVGRKDGDILLGNEGDDTLVPGHLSFDRVGEFDQVDGGEGIDLLILNYSDNLVLQIDNTEDGYIKGIFYEDTPNILTTFTNVEKIDVTGTQFNDRLKGKLGDKLDGFKYISVGAINDTLDFDLSNDTLDFDLSTVTDSLIVDLAQVDNIRYGDTLVRNFESIGVLSTGSGNDLINVPSSGGLRGSVQQISTGSGDDVIRLGVNGASGKGTIDGGEGTDLLVVDYAGSSTVAAGVFLNGSSEIRENITTALTILLNYQGVEQFNVYGTAFPDRLIGGSFNDVLSGDKGNDLLTGNKGEDILTGGEGRDTFVINGLDEGLDRITDFDGAIDLIDLRGIFKLPLFSNVPVQTRRQLIQLSQSDGSTQVKIASGLDSSAELTTLVILDNVLLNSTNQGFILS